MLIACCLHADCMLPRLGSAAAPPVRPLSDVVAREAHRRAARRAGAGLRGGDAPARCDAGDLCCDRPAPRGRVAGAAPLEAHLGARVPPTPQAPNSPIRSHQKPSEAIRSHQEPSEATRSHQKLPRAAPPKRPNAPSLSCPPPRLLSPPIPPRSAPPSIRYGAGWEGMRGRGASELPSTVSLGAEFPPPPPSHSHASPLGLIHSAGSSTRAELTSAVGLPSRSTAASTCPPSLRRLLAASPPPPLLLSSFLLPPSSLLPSLPISLPTIAPR